METSETAESTTVTMTTVGSDGGSVGLTQPVEELSVEVTDDMETVGGMETAGLADPGMELSTEVTDGAETAGLVDPGMELSTEVVNDASTPSPRSG